MKKMYAETKGNLKKIILTGSLLLGMPLLAACGTTTETNGTGKVVKDTYAIGQVAEKLELEELGKDSAKQKLGEHAHQFTETLEKEPTCTEAGVKVWQCVCGESRVESLEKKGHTDNGWQLLAEPTDETEGLEARLCQDCGIMLEMRAVPVKVMELQTSGESGNAEAETRPQPLTSTPAQEKPADTHTHVYEEEVARVEAECRKSGTIFTRCSCGDLHAETIPALGHDWEVCEQVEATCVTDGFEAKQCRNCKETEREEIPAKGHIPGEWVVVKEPTYTELGTKERRCTDCNTLMETENVEVLPHVHDYTEVINEEAGCTTDGIETLTCNVCGDVRTEVIPATGHNEAWETTKVATCTEAGVKSLKCSVCGNISEMESVPALGHAESDWIVDVEATCTTAGSRHKSCTRCGVEVAGGVIDATGHEFGEFETTKEPTCTEAGEQAKSCGICGETVTASIDAKGHSYGDWIMDTEPTEDAGGERHKECEDCGDRIAEDVDPLPRHDHDFGESGKIDSTCTQTGSVVYTCSICGENYSESIPMKAHTPGDWETEKVATEQETGLKTKKCTVCGTVVESEIIGKIPHLHDYSVNRVESDCVNDGYVEYTCECGDSYKEIINATGHSYGEAETVEPTCEKAGYVKRICTNCGDVITETIEKLEHNYVETERVEATCTADGYIEYTCSICGEVKTGKNGIATGHNFGEWEITTEARLGMDGEKTRTCKGCGEVETEKIDMPLTDGIDSVYYVDIGNGNQKMVIGHYDNVESEMIFELVNEMREENGLTPYLKSDYQDFTETRALELAVLWGHDRPNGKQFAYAENVAMAGGSHSASYAVADYFVDNWTNSSGHKANMLNPNAKYTSVAVFYELNTLSYWEYDTKSYEVYAAQNFSTYTRELLNQISHGDCEDL